MLPVVSVAIIGGVTFCALENWPTSARYLATFSVALLIVAAAL